MLLLSGIFNVNGLQPLAGTNGSNQRKSRGDGQCNFARQEQSSKSGHRKSGYSSSTHECSEQKVAMQQEKEEFVPRFTAVLLSKEGSSNQHSSSSSSSSPDASEFKREGKEEEGKKEEVAVVAELEEKEEGQKEEEPVTFRMTAQQHREEEIAESLFQAVYQIEPLYAGKVTGILLDGGYSEAQSLLLSSSTKLRHEVEEAKSRLLSKSKTNAKEKAAMLGSSSSSAKPVAPKAKVAISDKVASFDDMGLPKNLLRGIYTLFEKPSKCQTDAAGPLLNGKDLILQSQTGTGKTAAYLIPLLARIDMSCDRLQVLILCHFRELALQVHTMTQQLNAFHHVKLHLLIGGTSVGADIKALREPIQMLVGVPGRVSDLIQKSALDLRVVKTLVLDDGEQLLSKTSRDATLEIIQACPSTVQSVVCCVTAPSEMLEVCSEFMKNDGVRLLIPQAEIALKCIRHYIVHVDREEWKLETLCDILPWDLTPYLIFCNTSRKVQWLTEKMRARNFTVDSFHGDLEQRERERVFLDFVRGNSRVLICSGALAFGVDMPHVATVIHIDFPMSIEQYIQRVGRAGRFGRKGTSLCFVLPGEADRVKLVEQHFSIQLAELPPCVDDFLI